MSAVTDDRGIVTQRGAVDSTENSQNCSDWRILDARSVGRVDRIDHRGVTVKQSARTMLTLYIFISTARFDAQTSPVEAPLVLTISGTIQSAPATYVISN